MTKVLLVEDNEMNRDMLSRRLIRRGQVARPDHGHFQVVHAAVPQPRKLAAPIDHGAQAFRRQPHAGPDAVARCDGFKRFPDARRAPSPRLRGEGWGEGAFPRV